MPKEIKRSILLVLLSIFIGGVDLLLQFVGITKQNTEYGSPTDFFVHLLIVVVLLILIAKGKNWARWIFIVLIVLSIFPVIANVFLVEFKSDVVGAILSLIQATLYLLAVILLLQKPAVEWFKK